jgi:hypothetical protein
MKVFSQITLAAVMLIFISACGGNNKSGKNNDNGDCIYTLGGCSSAYSNGYTNNINSPYTYNGISVNTVLNENQCQSGPNRAQYTSQVTLPYVVQRGDLFVGVTSYGDVALVAGNGTATANFVAYLCPRGGTPMQAPLDVRLGVATRCQFKTMFAATLQFSSQEVALFRFLDGGSSRGTPFSICR